VIQERHAAFGVLLPLGVRKAFADDAGARDGTGKLSHDRGLVVRQAPLDGLPGRDLGGGGRLRHGVPGSGTLQVTDLLRQRVGLRLLGWLLVRSAGGDLGSCLDRWLSA
jgi:hypothetical protein